jgi:hypothetical protein
VGQVSEWQVVPLLHLQAGLRWTPGNWAPWLQVILGYEIEQWWNIGGVANTSPADLRTHGVFLRSELRY